jgi:choice-of-anchor B domain-containing protein
MRRLVGTIMILIMGYSQGAMAHADHDNARFVAIKGADTGFCNNRFRPCLTITYAAQQANKGDRILVAQGQYVIQSEQDLFYMIAPTVPVFGGYDQLDNYQSQNPNVYVTSVIGVPEAFTRQLSEQGFKVIRDKKSQNQPQLQGKSTSFSHLNLMQQKQSQANCVDSLSSGFSCNNISLLSHIPLGDFALSPFEANDIWGHKDLNSNKEYAIIGFNNGIAVVDVSTPEAPQIVGSIPGITTTWRDIKVYQYYDSNLFRWQAYAYATSEASEGLTIIDLNNLADGVSLVNRQTTDRTAHNIYISNVDYGLNIASSNTPPAVHILGSNNFDGSFRSYSLTDPEILGATYSNDQASTSSDYTHDAASLMITDSRAQTDCILSNNDGCLVMLDFNEKSLRLWDHSDINQSVELSDISYPNVEYTHSGWWSEDKQYVIVHDELDEQRRGLNTTLNIFDISSLTSPVLAGTWTGPTRAIDHNGFVRGNRYYMSNYERGLTILDISDPSTPSEVGFFDTYPISDNTTFNGAWGVYPFLPSGIILVSDINSGLYILQDDTLTSDTGSISFNSQEVQAEEGQTLNIEINKSGIGSTTVAYEFLSGSATQLDFSAQTGELSWSNEDNQPKNISVIINVDNTEEPDEVFFVRLFDPRNGATLAQPNITQITIVGASQAGRINFVMDQVTVKETDNSVILSVARSSGTNGDISVNYELRSDSALIGQDASAASGTLTWQDGQSEDQNIQITLIDDNESEQQETLLLVLTSEDSNLLGTQTSATITIRDDDSNQPPTSNAGDDFQVNTSQNTTLNGLGSDPEGQPLTYLWQQVSGTIVTINNASNAQANFSAPRVAGILEFSLTVSDDFAATTTDNIQVTVRAPTTNTNTSSGGGGINPLYLLILVFIRLLAKTAENTSN